MKQMFLHGFSVDQLIDEIGKLIDRKIGKPDQKSSDSPANQFITREEVAGLLKISLPTLHNWTKLGRLQSYKIGTRVLYKVAEVENSLHKVGTLKFKKGGYHEA